jgi:hypothetical protein
MEEITRITAWDDKPNNPCRAVPGLTKEEVVWKKCPIQTWWTVVLS